MTDMLQKGQEWLASNSPSMRLAKLYIAEESWEPRSKQRSASRCTTRTMARAL